MDGHLNYNVRLGEMNMSSLNRDGRSCRFDFTFENDSVTSTSTS